MTRGIIVGLLFLVLLLHGEGKYGAEAQADPTCTSKVMDLVIVMDESGSVGYSNFQKMKDFVKQLVRNITVSDTTTHVGLLKFSTRATVEFQLDKYTTTQAVVGHVNSLSNNNGTTHTEHALDAAQRIFSSSGRSGAVQVAFVLTDGRATLKDEAQIAATNLKATGVRIITVGIGSNLDKVELESMASSKDDSKLAANFNALLASVNEMTATICQPTITASPPRCPPPSQETTCTGKVMDLVAVLDDSGSVRAGNFEKEKDFVKQLVQNITVSDTTTHVSVVKFSTYAIVEFELDKYTTTGAVVDHVDSLTYSQGYTYIDRALKAVQGIFSSSSRPEAVHVTLFLTDGNATRKDEAQIAATNLKATGVRIITVGIGSRLDIPALESYASSKEDSLLAANFDALLTSVNKITAKICQTTTTDAGDGCPTP